MRIHIPDSLKANFRHLDGMCYELKQKFHSLKRNVKFDDDIMDLYADVQLTPDAPWKRLSPADARIVRAKGNFVPEQSSLTPDVLDDLLSSDRAPALGANAIPLDQDQGNS